MTRLKNIQELTGEDAVSAQEQGQALLESLIDDVGEALPNIDELTESKMIFKTVNRRT